MSDWMSGEREKNEKNIEEEGEEVKKPKETKTHSHTQRMRYGVMEKNKWSLKLI